MSTPVFSGRGKVILKPLAHNGDLLSKVPATEFSFPTIPDTDALCDDTSLKYPIPLSHGSAASRGGRLYMEDTIAVIPTVTRRLPRQYSRTSSYGSVETATSPIALTSSPTQKSRLISHQNSERRSYFAVFDGMWP